MTETQQQALVTQAQERANAYAPYSKFAVGAALLGDDGRVFRGVNVENNSFGLTICAERTAAVSAVAAGAKGFRAIAVVTDGGHSPCGACRQFLHEWGPELIVLLADEDERAPIETYRLGDLLPHGFHFGNQ